MYQCSNSTVPNKAGKTRISIVSWMVQEMLHQPIQLSFVSFDNSLNNMSKTYTKSSLLQGHANLGVNPCQTHPMDHPHTIDGIHGIKPRVLMESSQFCSRFMPHNMLNIRRTNPCACEVNSCMLQSLVVCQRPLHALPRQL